MVTVFVQADNHQFKGEKAPDFRNKLKNPQVIYANSLYRLPEIKYTQSSSQVCMHTFTHKLFSELAWGSLSQKNLPVFL